MTDFHADLHCHTTCSDGSMSPEEVVKLAHTSGLKGLSITDHDSIDAYPGVLELAKNAGIRMISGIELSTMHKNTSIHVLGYSFNLKDPKMHEFCQRHRLRREERNRQILEKLEKLNMTLTMNEIADREKAGTVGRPHIAIAMVKKGYISTLEEAFKVYLGEGKLCYVPGNPFSVEETLDVIHQAQGFGVIAHPHLVQNDKILKDLLAMPFDGLECYYARFPKEKHERWLQVAKKRGFLITGGSDFHGEIKAMIPLGCSWIDEQHFSLLEQRFLSHST